jgi:hypothetical protein
VVNIKGRREKETKEKTRIWREGIVRRRERRGDKGRRRELEKISLKDKIYVLLCKIASIN